MRTWIEKSYWLPVQKFRGKKEHVLYPCLASLKIDGELGFLVVRDGQAVLVNKPKYGRWRTDFPITEIAKRILPDGIYLGELHYGEGRTKQDFYDLLRHKYSDELRFALFGVLCFEDQKPVATEETIEFLTEMKNKLPKSSPLFVVPFWITKSKLELEQLAVNVLSEGWEGLVVRNMRTVWREGSSCDWIKIKRKDRELMGSYGWTF